MSFFVPGHLTAVLGIKQKTNLVLGEPRLLAEGPEIVLESLGCHVQLLGIVALRLLPKARQKQTERKEVRSRRKRRLAVTNPVFMA